MIETREPYLTGFLFLVELAAITNIAHKYKFYIHVDLWLTYARVSVVVIILHNVYH